MPAGEPDQTIRRLASIDIEVVNSSTRNSCVQAGATGQLGQLRSAVLNHFCFLSQLTLGVALIFFFTYSRLQSESARP
jgi:hypothetical protein